MKSLGNYELVERLGVGGMAEVFLAKVRRQGDFYQPCVVKLLHRQLARDENFVRLLLEEARLIAGLRHNNIASLYDVGREEGNLFLVMEFVDGRDLHAILATSVRNEKPLPLGFAVHVAQHLCRGLHFAHTRQDPASGAALNLVHRDVSPQNILISILGEVKLIDFGVAKFNSALREQTRAGVIKGKFGYMSPEQAFDEPLDGRSDIFSLGICLYEMLTGRSLYGQSDDPITMLKRARAAAIEPISHLRPEVPTQLAEIVHRALAKNRDLRFQSAHELERALARFQSEHSPDYTNLDAGDLLRELFQVSDPALNEISPSGRESTSSNQVLPAEIEESTKPIADIPEEVRHSGSFAAQSRSELRIDPDEPTRAILFDEDAFAVEKTELFDENRVSGAHPTVERDKLSVRSTSSSPGRNRSRHTREIRDQKAPKGLTQQDDPTNPRRSVAAPSKPSSPTRPSKPLISPKEEEIPPKDEEITAKRTKKEDPSPLLPDNLSLLGEREPFEEYHPEEDLDISLELDIPEAADSRRAHPATQKSPVLTTQVESSPRELPAALQDRRVQIGGASVFVVLAFLFLLSRFLF